jgi:DNA primase catalytic core, N-terminal domain
MLVPQNFVIQTFFQYTKRPTYRKTTNTYAGECPYCHEGKSAGKKRRFFYIPEDDHLFCHNCGESKNGLEFVKEQTHMSVSEILAESGSHADTIEDLIKKSDFYKKANPNPLPYDSINLFDSNQVSFYKENQVVKDALKFITKRRLDTAVNRPKSLWISLTDMTHKNRVVFPFYNTEGKIITYQSRALYREDEDKAKYLTKANSEKGVFNLDKVSPDIDYIFLQEGPIDAMFLRNSVALAGIHPTEEQLEMLQKAYPMHNLIYVLDNQWVDKTSYKVTKELLGKGESVFIWPKEYNRYKDLNELCIVQNKDEVSHAIITQNTYIGMKGLIQFSQIKRPV